MSTNTLISCAQQQDAQGVFQKLQVSASERSNLISREGAQAAHEAIKNDSDMILSILLEAGVVPTDIPVGSGRTLVYWSAKLNAPNSLRMLSDINPHTAFVCDTRGWTPIHSAAFNGHTQILKIILSNPHFDAAKHLGATTNQGWTPLHLAAQKDKVEAVRLMVTAARDAGTNACATIINHAANPAERTPLYTTVQVGNTEITRILCEIGSANVNLPTKELWAPIHSAAYNGFAEIAQILLLHGANPNVAEKAGWYPIHLAATRKHHKIIDLLIFAGADFTVKSLNGKSALEISKDQHYQPAIDLLTIAVKNSSKIRVFKPPVNTAAVASAASSSATGKFNPKDLFDAAKDGDHELCRTILDSGVNPNQTVTANGTWLPIHAAANNGHAVVVSLLASAGARINEVEGKGWTPLALAVFAGKIGVVSVLCMLGADISKPLPSTATPIYLATQKGYSDVMKVLLAHKANPVQKKKDGWAPLHSGAYNNQVECVKLLLEYIENPQDINAPEKDGWTPLHLCTQRPPSDVFQILLDHPLIDVHATTKAGSSCMYVAAMKNRPEKFKLLAEKGLSVNTKNTDGTFPLYQAARQGFTECVATLISIPGIDVNARRPNGWTALHSAAYNGNVDVIELLVNIDGCQIDSVDKDGFTPLHLACQELRVDAVRALAIRGASVSSKTQFGRTPLHTAVVKGNLEVIKCLLEMGASLSSTDKQGRTPIVLARENKKHDVVSFLNSLQ